MTFDEILERLETHDAYPFQREALQEAIKRQEDITPALLDIIAFSANNPNWLEENPDYMGFTYAIFLLAQFREKKAYPLIVKYVSQLSNDDNALDSTGALITEDLGSILASACNGDLSLIKQLIENPEINEYVRSAALESLVVLYKHELLTRTVNGSLKLYGFGYFENVVFSSVFSLNIKKNLVVVGFYSIFFFLRDGVVGIAVIY